MGEISLAQTGWPYLVRVGRLDDAGRRYGWVVDNRGAGCVAGVATRHRDGMKMVLIHRVRQVLGAPGMRPQFLQVGSAVSMVAVYMRMRERSHTLQ